EALKKQLDQRSTYLSENRDLLRITQRGMESVNVGGSIIEKIVLRVPPAFTTIQLFEVKEECASEPTAAEKTQACKEKKSVLNPSVALHQPLYARVEALAVNLAVVRLPYHLKRSATEKF